MCPPFKHRLGSPTGFPTPTSEFHTLHPTRRGFLFHCDRHTDAAHCVGRCSALRWQMQRTALADAARCVGGCSTVRWRMQRTALADAARCVGRCSTVRWRMQRAALADAAHCVGRCSTVRWRMQRAALASPPPWGRLGGGSLTVGRGLADGWEGARLYRIKRERHILLPLGEGGGWWLTAGRPGKGTRMMGAGTNRDCTGMDIVPKKQ